MITQENIPYTTDEIKAMVKTCEKYNKALERAREQYNKRTPLYDIESIFPELKENEDERIRNFLIDFIKICTWTEKKDQGWPLREDCLDWLEKQKNKD